MNLADDLRRTLTDVTDRVLEKGQQLSREAQLQVHLKKLQVEYAKYIHQLGKRTYDWHLSGTMIASVPAPAEVTKLCAQLDATQRQIAATQREIEEVRRQSASTPAAVHDVESS
jgi:hypothetical protein